MSHTVSPQYKSSASCLPRSGTSMFMQCHGDLVVAISGFISELIVGKRATSFRIDENFHFSNKNVTFGGSSLSTG